MTSVTSIKSEKRRSVASATTASASNANPNKRSRLATSKQKNDDPSTSRVASGNEEASQESSIVSYRLHDADPAVEAEDGLAFYESITISSADAEPFTVRRGDAVYLESELNSGSPPLPVGKSGQSATTKSTLVCRVDGFIAPKRFMKDDVAIDSCSPSVIRIKGRWLFEHKQLLQKMGGSVTPETMERCKDLRSDELVLTSVSVSPSTQYKSVTLIQGICRVIYIKKGEALPAPRPPYTAICRYKLQMDARQKTVQWESIKDYDIPVHNDKGNDETVDGTISSASNEEKEEEDDSSTSSSSSEDVSCEAIQEGEGTTLRGDIQVGSKFQIKVGPFVTGQTVSSRGPKLVYSPGKISDQMLLAFLERVAVLHNAHLDSHNMLMEEPYTPLPHSRAEEIMRETPGHPPLTGSFMSTASMLASCSGLGNRRSQLQKECSPDDVMEVLVDHNYDTEAAFAAIASNIDKITEAWTRPEKDIFDDGFRRHQGALRSIAKVIGPTKSMKDVVDYYYRFKIPDQFRKYQEKKREQAVRMVECIETRKYHESNSTPAASSMQGTNSGSNMATMSGNNSDENRKASDTHDSRNKGTASPAIGKHWSEKPIASIATAKDERVHNAKTLLLDVKDKFGRDTMAEVATVIRQLQVAYEPETRDDLFKLLHTQPELQKRFLEFLPKHF